MGLGSDLMLFFAKDAPQAGDTGRTLRDFHEMYEAEYPHQAVTLRACNALCAAGRLFEQGPGLGLPVFANRYMCTKTHAELEPDIAYGTYDFLVEGMPAIHRAFAPSVLMLEVVPVTGDPAQGSAFAVRPDVLLTARHCVEGMASVKVLVPSALDGEVTPFKTVVPDGHIDVAALFLAKPVAVHTFRVREPQLLEEVMTMGYPRMHGLYPALISSVGQIAGRAVSYLDSEPYWITTCAMTGGSSGGPVIGADGSAVGVVSSRPASDAGTDPGGFGYVSGCVQAVSSITANVELGRALSDG